MHQVTNCHKERIYELSQIQALLLDHQTHHSPRLSGAISDPTSCCIYLGMAPE